MVIGRNEGRKRKKLEDGFLSKRMKQRIREFLGGLQINKMGLYLVLIVCISFNSFLQSITNIRLTRLFVLSK